MTKLVKFPNGVVVDVSKIVMILRRELNEYVVIMEGRPEGALISGADLDALVAHGDIVTVLTEKSPLAV